MKSIIHLLQSHLSSGNAKWSKEKLSGLLIFFTVIALVTGTHASLILLPTLVTWGFRLYHWHRRKTLEEKQKEAEIEAMKNQEKRNQEKHNSDLQRAQKMNDAQIKIAEQIVQKVVDSPTTSEISSGKNPVLGDNFQAKIAPEVDEDKASSKVRHINDR